jgi:hypothetical protein
MKFVTFTVRSYRERGLHQEAYGDKPESKI